ncbi:MAG: hypothetical protein QNJ90_16350 [Planctomycetota bacterium]|nr:hypothetical protein [Planctomycetota bacterium]
MTRRGKAGLAILALMALVGVGYLVKGRMQATQPTAVPVELQTTHVTEPLDAEGRVDFLAALGASPMPAPDQNAAIPLLRALGTDSLLGEKQAILRQLGAPSDLPAPGLLVPRPDDVPTWIEPEERSAEDQAAVRAWVARNEEAFEVLEQASRRPHLAWPFVRDGEAGLAQRAVRYGAWPRITDLLMARAENHLAEAKPREGLRAMQVLLRIGLLHDDSPLVVERLLGTSIRSNALAWVGSALASGALDEDACRDFGRVLRSLPAPVGLDREVLRNERLVLLDGYLHQIAREIEASGGDPAWHPANVSVTTVLREINRRFDAVDVLIRPTQAEMLQPMRDHASGVREEVKSLRDELQSTTAITRLVLDELAGGGEQKGRVVGTVLSSMVVTVLPFAIERSVSSEAHRQLVLTALALRIHERRTDSFPASLEDLEPGLLPDLSQGPLDLADVSYERNESGCILEIESDVLTESIEIAGGTR